MELVIGLVTIVIWGLGMAYAGCQLGKLDKTLGDHKKKNKSWRSSETRPSRYFFT